MVIFDDTSKINNDGSGCYFCFFQRKNEWAGLLEHHPDLFEKAKAYEKFNPDTGERYTWQGGESLDELAQPHRLAQIRKKAATPTSVNQTLANVFATDDEDGDRACLICDL